MSEKNFLDLFLDIKLMKKDSLQKTLKLCKYTLQTLYTSSILNMIVETISMVLIEPLFTVRPKYLSSCIGRGGGLKTGGCHMYCVNHDLHLQSLSKHIYKNISIT